MYSNVLILREKNEKTMRAIHRITRKGWCIFLDQKTHSFPSDSYSLLLISQHVLPSQKQCGKQIIPALKCIKCIFNLCFRQLAHRKLLEDIPRLLISSSSTYYRCRARNLSQNLPTMNCKFINFVASFNKVYLSKYEQFGGKRNAFYFLKRT